MSAAESPTPLESKLEALQCHFTWDIDFSRSKLLRVRDKLEDIGADEGNCWLGHIYNLQGYIHYQLGLTEDAGSFFIRAAEAFCHMRKAASDEGPWLVVNYGNRAWLHHHLGEEAESQAYLSKVDALMNKYPSPSEEELHQEIYAEKAWTLMKLSKDKMLLAADYFERAFRMQPDMVQWQTSGVIALNHGSNQNKGRNADILRKMRVAMEQDPENLYLTVYYFKQLAIKGERIEDDVRELAKQILRNPVSSYSGFLAFLGLYRNYISIDEAIELAEKALEQHPDNRYLKRCAVFCYKWKIICFRDTRPDQRMIDRAITLHKEMISLYPLSSFVNKIDLAYLYAKSNNGLAEAEQMYQEMLESDLEPADKQMLYNSYAKYLHFDRHEHQRSIVYHQKAAEIPHQSFFRKNSIRILEKIEERSRNRTFKRW